MANVLSAEGRGEDVITLCKKAIAVDSHSTQAYTLIGEVYMENKDHENARKYLEKAVEIQPKLTRNGQNLAACLIGLKQYSEAETLLKNIIEETPRFPLSHFHMGLLKEEQGSYDDARKFYEAEIELYDKSVPARFNLGKLLFRAGDKQGYIDQMEEVVKLAPKMGEGFLFLARGLLGESQDLDRILELVQKGVSLAGSSRLKAFGYFLMADVYNRKKQPQRVAEALEKANYFKKENSLQH
jgi:tetratricopeptide (TPR) repeat protein